VRLTPEQWYELCTRDGKYYLGGCCGQLSCFQDFLNAIFRDDGWVYAASLKEAVEGVKSHEGMESFKDADALLQTSYNKLHDPIDRMAVVWHCVKDVVAGAPLVYPEPIDFGNVKQLCKLVAKTAARLGFSILKRDHDKIMDSAYVHLWPQLKLLHDLLMGTYKDNELLRRYIVYKEDQPVVINDLWPLLENLEDAQKIVSSWAEQDVELNVRTCYINPRTGFISGKGEV
jgi:hypothetical protein